MGRAGFHSGETFCDRVKSNGAIIPNSTWVPVTDLVADGTLSGVGSANVSGTFATPYVLNQTNTPSLKFDASTENVALLSMATPSCVGKKTKAKLKLYWTSSGTSNGVVCWDADYLSTAKWASGVSLTDANANYSLSGTVSNVTATGSHDGKSAILNVTELDIPAEDVKANELMKVILYRDADESADTLVAPALLLGVLVEYVDG